MPVIITSVFTIPVIESTVLWRYLNFEKFESIFEQNALFFCRLSKFRDNFEGSLPQKEVVCRNSKYKNHALAEFHKDFKEKVCVNCWQINDMEASLMWDAYIKDGKGLLIQTTAKKLQLCFEETDKFIYASKVRYIDFEKESWYHHNEFSYKGYNFYTPVIHKKKEYLHEQEYRLFFEVNDTGAESEEYWKNQKSEKGMFISVDVSKLIERIILPPESDSIFKEKILEVISKYGYSFPVEFSKLDNNPIY